MYAKQPAFSDEYDHLDDAIEYILENQLQPDDGTASFVDLKEKFHSTFLAHCSCAGDSNCSQSDDCQYGGNYAWHENERILNTQRRCKDLIYECFELCTCPPNCHNRLVQFGPRRGLAVKDFSHLHKQLGLVCHDPVPAGGFICEYTGELLTKDEAMRRNAENEASGAMNYILCINERSLDGDSVDQLQFFIDPSRRGNIGRYANHSCRPNCELISVRVGHFIPKLGIFAKQDIAAGEEVCFDYGGGEVRESSSVSTGRKLCFCGTDECRKYLPNIGY
jgi:[histone H3]-lysine36 N-dimethyltransferase SETMAR